MTDRAGILLLLLALCLSANAQTARTSSGRVSSEGPYKSQVRLLEEHAATEATDDELLASTAQNAYGRALVLRQLAQRGIATGDSDAAIDHYEQALALGSLSPLAMTQMQINLGQLYTLAGRYNEAVALLAAAMIEDEFSDPPLMMSLASAYLQNDQPADAARQAARAINAAGANAAPEWIEFAVYAFWAAGESAEAAKWQLQVLEASPDEAGLWIQLAALYRTAGQPARALATLQAAALSGLLVDDDDWLTLIQMHLEYGTPDLATQWLKPLVDARPEAQRWQWLGQVLLRSGDEIAALSALERWAELDATPEAWLEVGELAASVARPGIAVSALRRAAAARAEGGVRGRALLLLGQVEMERGNTNAAKRAFRQAADYGGVYRAATEWLDFLNRSTELPAGDATLSATTSLGDQTDTTATTPPLPQVAIKSVGLLRVYTGSSETTASALTDTATDLVERLVRASRRERLEWTGPLHIVVTGDIGDPSHRIDVTVAAPVRRAAPPRGGFGSGKLEAFRCVWQRYEGPADGLEQAWRDLYAQTLAAGLQPTQEARQIVLHRGDRRSSAVVELQIGIL